MTLAHNFIDTTSKLELVLIRCQQHCLVLKIKKSWIGNDIVTFFGYEVRPGSWSSSQTRKDAVQDIIFPTTQKSMQSFLGAANFFHTHIPNYASWASSLYECTATGFNWNPTSWSKDYKQLFDIFKTAIQKSVTLHFPDYVLRWIIRSDSSDRAVGAVLFQEYSAPSGDVIHQPIALTSHKYSGAAINWDTYKQEDYALFYAVSQFDYYLGGKPFVLETDHRNLVKSPSSSAGVCFFRLTLLKLNTFLAKTTPSLTGYPACILYRPSYPSLQLSALQNTRRLTLCSNTSTAIDLFATVQRRHILHSANDILVIIYPSV